MVYSGVSKRIVLEIDMEYYRRFIDICSELRAGVKPRDLHDRSRCLEAIIDIVEDIRYKLRKKGQDLYTVYVKPRL